MIGILYGLFRTVLHDYVFAFHLKRSSTQNGFNELKLLDST